MALDVSGLVSSVDQMKTVEQGMGETITTFVSAFADIRQRLIDLQNQTSDPAVQAALNAITDDINKTTTDLQAKTQQIQDALVNGTPAASQGRGQGQAGSKQHKP